MTANTIELPDYLLETTTHLSNRLNEYLESVDAPAIGLHNDPINRSQDFVEFEAWLKTSDIDVLDDLIEQFGLIPLVFSLSGTDVTYSTLLQKGETVKLDGYVRYIDSALIRTTGGRAIEINQIGKSLFGDEFELAKQHKMRAKFASKIIEIFINTQLGIPYSHALLMLLDITK